jgi:DNA-binding MarR family transcriptional regulator
MEDIFLLSEERERIKAEILHSLWQEGASSFHKLIKRLGIVNSIMCECLDDLIVRKWVYRLWESPIDEQATVFYLTERTRKIFRKAVADNPRYRMKRFWEALKREDGGLPKVSSNF